MQPVALTFDDGPYLEWTRTILGVLEKRSIKATFFVWGEQACQHGDGRPRSPPRRTLGAAPLLAAQVSSGPHAV